MREKTVADLQKFLAQFSEDASAIWAIVFFLKFDINGKIGHPTKVTAPAKRRGWPKGKPRAKK